MDEQENGNSEHCPEKRHGPKTRVFVLALLGVSLLLVALIVKPFYKVIIFAIILAVLLAPLQSWAVRKLKGRRNISALTVTLAAGLLIVAPIMAMLSIFFMQAADFAAEAADWVEKGRLEDLLAQFRAGAVGDWLQTNLPFIPDGMVNLKETLPGYAQNLGQRLLEYGGGFAGGLVISVSHFFMMMFMLFFFVRDGRDMLENLLKISPMSEEQDRRILTRIHEASRGVFFGNLLTALCQGAAAGVGLAIVGLPGLFLGALTALASMVPLLGTGLVSIPAIIWLAATAQWTSAVILSIWVLLLVNPIDNYLRPFFMRGAGSRSTLFIFIAVVGGIAYFGISGLVFGPLILALASAMLSIYRQEFGGKEE
jgi:predicted PurR-regulated permease PerM